MPAARLFGVSKHFAWFLVLITTPTFLHSQDATYVYRTVRPSIAFIESDHGGGTGFCIDHSGVVATALHVVDGASSLAVTIRAKRYEHVDLIALDTTKDLALLKLPDTPCTQVNLSLTEPAPGTRVFVIGNPLADKALEASISDGLVSGLRDLKLGYKALQISAPLSPGNSGGPVVDERGRVIAVVVFKLTAGELLNFAVPAHELVPLLKQQSSSSPPIHQWSPDEHGSFRSLANQQASPLSSLFAKAKAASGTCALVDYKISETVYLADGTSYDREVIEGNFGSIATSLVRDAKTGRLLTMISGRGAKGAWQRIGDTTKALPRSPDELVNSIVNNYYCFCDEFAALWIDPEISEEQFNGKRAIRVSTKDKFLGSPVTFWFDSSTYLVIGRRYVNLVQGLPVIGVDTFSDFQQVGAFMIPFRTEQTTSKPSSTHLVVRKFVANVGYPEYIFNQLP